MKLEILLIFLILKTSSYAQEIIAGNKINVEVNATVQVIDTLLYRFKYSISNMKESHQDIWTFQIILKYEPLFIKNKLTIPGWWKPSILPDPPYWIGWASPEKSNIRPGCSVSGFGFDTDNKVHIGILDYYVEGRHPVPKFNEGMAPDIIKGYHDLTPYGPGIVGKTIGPVPLSDKFMISIFLDTLISYLSQSDSFGWIKSKDSFDKYHSYFDKAKSCLEQNDNAATINVLGSVLTDVEVDKDKSLTSEAWALIKYNTEYLKNQILLKSKK